MPNFIKNGLIYQTTSNHTLPVSAKTCDIFTNFFLNFADRTKKSGLAVVAEPDCGSYLVFQIVRVGCFRCNEGIECELSAEAEAGDEAVECGLAVDGCPGIDVLEESFLFLAGELIREEVLVIGEGLHIVLYLFILLEAARLRVDIAVVELFYKICHGSFSLFLLRNPCVHAVKNVVFSMVFVRVLTLPYHSAGPEKALAKASAFCFFIETCHYEKIKRPSFRCKMFAAKKCSCHSIQRRSLYLTQTPLLSKRG